MIAIAPLAHASVQINETVKGQKKHARADRSGFREAAATLFSAPSSHLTLPAI